MRNIWKGGSHLHKQVKRNLKPKTAHIEVEKLQKSEALKISQQAIHTKNIKIIYGNKQRLVPP